jgi:hypothetical protein
MGGARDCISFAHIFASMKQNLAIKQEHSNQANNAGIMLISWWKIYHFMMVLPVFIATILDIYR